MKNADLLSKQQLTKIIGKGLDEVGVFIYSVSSLNENNQFEKLHLIDNGIESSKEIVNTSISF